MPETCRFFGIIIRMYFGDHPPPHFHLEYGEHRAVIDSYWGMPSASSMGLVVEWASQHQEELLELWKRAANYQPLFKLPPLA